MTDARAAGPSGTHPAPGAAQAPGPAGSVFVGHPSAGSYRTDLLMLSVALIWGMNFAIMKGLYAWFDPFAFSAIRFLTAATTLVSFLHLRGYSMRIDRRDLPAVAGLGVLSNTVYQFFFVSGLAQTKAGNAALIGAAAPIFAYVTGILLKREGYSHRVLAGILMSFAGVAVIVLFGSREISLGGNWKGDSMILISSLCWGFYTGAAARLILKYGAVRLTVWLMISGTIFMIPPFLPFVLRQNWHAIPPVAWLGFCYSTFLSIVYCYLIWSYALQMVGVSRTAVFSNMTPLIALVGGWLILGEDPAVAQLGGAALILTGIFIVRSRKLQAGIGVDIRRARADRSL